MRRRAPVLSLESVIDELRTPPALEGRQPERVYLVLEKHDQHVYLATGSEDIEGRLEGLMSELWVPLGFVSYYPDSPNPKTSSLNWYADLLSRDERRYGHLCSIVSARLQEAARRLTYELWESRVIPRAQ